MSICAECARIQETCCQRAATVVALTRGDIERISRFSGQDCFFELKAVEGDLKHIYANPANCSDDDRIYVANLFDREGRRNVLKKKANGECRFLTGDGCQLPPDVRPIVCRLYPYEWNDRREVWLEPDYCPRMLFKDDEDLIAKIGLRAEAAQHLVALLYREITEGRQRPVSGRAVVILHDQISADARTDELDDLVQMEAVTGAMQRMGFEVVSLPFSRYGLADLSARLHRINPLFAVNLVEAVDGDATVCFAACAVLESLKIKFTGNSAEAMLLTTNKICTKQLLRGFGLNTPEWVESTGDGTYLAGERYLIKPVSQGGSVGIHDASIVLVQSAEELVERVCRESKATGRECFAERFIDGREFNLSLLGCEDGPKVLPAAEILFNGYKERGLPKIVHYDAKWNPDSYAYDHSIRTFEVGEQDCGLIAEMSDAAKKCWRLFRIKGYARIDFRVDDGGRPWIIDLNLNPCISGDSGFVAAAARAGLGFDQMIEGIINETCAVRIAT